ncbi:HD domain-containing protein [Methanococcoides sp. SA1]|nr:HD domain-containing protein [Methanococcoides sp. SA1]
MKACGCSVGRRIKNVDVGVGDSFKSDFFKILESKSFRRLSDKTQVWTSPDNPHVRSRAVHTYEVISLSSLIAERLGLNVWLCMAIAAGHDLGHPPYGHIGERTLSRLGKNSFRHEVNSVVIAQHIERRGFGLQLTYETLRGMLLHSRRGRKMDGMENELNEYSVVMYADKIAYTLSDLNDAMRKGYLSVEDVPDFGMRLGKTQRIRKERLVDALVAESLRKGRVCFGEGKIFEDFKRLRDFMYAEVYGKSDGPMNEVTIESICAYFERHEEFDGCDPILLTSLLTDREANRFGELFVRSADPDVEELKMLGIFEIIPHIRGKGIRYWDADLREKDFLRGNL